MKKIVSKILILALVMSTLCTVSGIGDTQTARAAEQIQNKEQFSGKIGIKARAKYVYKAKKSGYFYIKADTGRNLDFTVKVAGRTYKESTCTDYKSRWFACAAGQTVSITILGDENEVVGYKFKLIHNPCKIYEKEPNNSKSKATELKLGTSKACYGYVLERDVDWYVFKAPKTKKYRILTRKLKTDGYMYTAKAYSPNKKIHTSKEMVSEDGCCLLSGVLQKGQKVYIKLNYGGEDKLYKVWVK